MEPEDVKWCPQHGYPLPCYKCGMPLTQPQQKEIYELGKKAGIKYTLSRAVSEGFLSVVNGKHGIHIPDELYEELKEKSDA